MQLVDLKLNKRITEPSLVDPDGMSIRIEYDVFIHQTDKQITKFILHIRSCEYNLDSNEFNKYIICQILELAGKENYKIASITFQ